MITMQGVSKRFGKRVVLDGLHGAVTAGRITALIGPNGAGKTTLIKLLLGLARPDSGTIAINGSAIDRSPEYRRFIGYMPQVARFPNHRSGRELLATLAALRGDNADPDLSLADAFGLGQDFDRPLGVLSGGTRQKVNAVLAFAFRPRLLIIDEPTAGLDPIACRVLKDRILAMRGGGGTVLVTSHVLPELEELADDVVFMADGSVAWSGGMGALRRRTGENTLERAIARLLAGPALLDVA